MNPDQKLIQCAYEDAIRMLYGKLFEAYSGAGGDTTQNQQAEQRFMAGIRLARTSRDRALALLAEPATAAGA